MPARQFVIALAWVFAGGGLGTMARAGIDQAFTSHSWPWPTLAVNLVGTALLAWLLTWSTGRPNAWRWGNPIRLGVGTGLLGGFTTYSAFGVQICQLWQNRPWLATAYAVGSLAAGVAAGLVAAGLTERHRARHRAQP